MLVARNTLKQCLGKLQHITMGHQDNPVVGTLCLKFCNLGAYAISLGSYTLNTPPPVVLIHGVLSPYLLV